MNYINLKTMERYTDCTSEEGKEVIDWFSSLSKEEKEMIKNTIFLEILPKLKKEKDILTFNEKCELVKIKIDQ